MDRSALFVTTVPITLEAFLLPFADHFREQGWRVDALANGAGRDGAIASHFDGRFDVDWSRRPLDGNNLGPSIRRVREIVAHGRYDLVHVHTPIAAFVTRYALRDRGPSGPRVVYTCHGFHFYDGQAALPHALYRGLERLAAPWTDVLVTVNEEDRAAASRLGGIDPGRVRLIPGIGVDVSRFADDAERAARATALRDELGIAPDAFVVTMIAELAPVKRHAHLLEALARVKDPRVVLVLAGDGPLAERLRGLAAELGVDGRVRWAGYRRDVPDLLAASDAAALVSEREGLPRSVLEAMASGIPVIGTATRGIADAVGDEAGWIVPKDDAAALAAAIGAASADPDACATRGAAGRRRASERFALPRIVDAYEELYRDVLA